MSICATCSWNGTRHQKCSCCRYNLNLKDNYEPIQITLTAEADELKEVVSRSARIFDGWGWED